MKGLYGERMAFNLKFIDEFKAFALKGNVVDMAVGVIVGGAFGKIVSSLVSDVIMPVFSFLTQGMSISGMKYDLPGGNAVIAYGAFLQNVVDFLLISVSIFLMIKLMSKLRRKAKEPPAPEPPKGPTAEELLSEIRDLLAEQKAAAVLLSDQVLTEDSADGPQQ